MFYYVFLFSQLTHNMCVQKSWVIGQGKNNIADLKIKNRTKYVDFQAIRRIRRSAKFPI